MDRRQRKTRDAIFNAFADLLGQQAYHRITVQQIIDAVLPAVVQQMAPGGIILCETERNEQLPEQAGDYTLTKTYFYGKAKITAYRRQEEA